MVSLDNHTNRLLSDLPNFRHLGQHISTDPKYGSNKTNPEIQRDTVTSITSKIQECRNTFTAIATYK